MHQSLNTVSNLTDEQPQLETADHGPDHDVPLEHASTSTRVATLIGVALPFAGFVAAVAFLWGRGFDWLHLVLFLCMYVLTAIGITVGYHRYFTHKAFRTNRAVEYTLAILGGMALEGPVLKWAAMHRFHHQHSDKPGDPHSPHTHHHGDHDDHGPGIVGVIKGFWHAHMGWMFLPDPKDLHRYVPDLSADRALRAISDLWVLWSILGMIIPGVIAGLITQSWTGALLGFLWGGLARIFLVHHLTWSINSVCHLWGSRPFRSNDLSRNNVLFGILGLGEGWHNNHHAFPTSARHGLRWWQIDVSYYIIRTLAFFGLAWDIKLPPADRMASKLA
jgi:stearoyl-CoA desaturase (delta-9 desaturase)